MTMSTFDMSRHWPPRHNTPVDGIGMSDYDRNRINRNAQGSHAGDVSDLPHQVELPDRTRDQTTPPAQNLNNSSSLALNTPVTPLTPTSSQSEIESDLPSAGFGGPEVEFGQPANVGGQSLQDPIVSTDNNISDHFDNSQTLPPSPQIRIPYQVLQHFYQARANAEMASNQYNRSAGVPGYGSGGFDHNQMMNTQFNPHAAASSTGNNQFIANQYGAPTAVGNFSNNQFIVNQSVVPSGPNTIDYSFDVGNPPPFVDLTRFARPSNGPVVRINNVSRLSLPLNHLAVVHTSPQVLPAAV